MASEQPEFAQQFEAAATHLMKLISDADWRQEQMKRLGPSALTSQVGTLLPQDGVEVGAFECEGTVPG